jgi:hypothetical protein
MTLTTRSRPSSHTASRLLQESLDAGHVRSIVGRWMVTDEGRTKVRSHQASTSCSANRIGHCSSITHPRPQACDLATTWSTHDVALIDDSVRISTQSIDAVVKWYCR